MQETVVSKKKQSNGPPTKYNPLWHPQLAFWMARDGLIEKDIAKQLKVCKRTITTWKNLYPEFKAALKEGKKKPDDLVETKLFQRATGYSFPEDKIMQYEGEPVIVTTIKHIPPDVVAQIFWLKNRRPDQWRDRHEIDFTDKLDEMIESFRGIK